MTPEPTAVLAWTAGAVLGLGALVTAITAIVRGSRALAAFMRRWDHFFREWFGEPADSQRGTPRKPGVPERLGAVESHMGRLCDRVSEVDAQVQRVVHEMHPNSGASLRDAVNRIEERTTAPTPVVHQTFVTPADTDRLEPPTEE